MRRIEEEKEGGLENGNITLKPSQHHLEYHVYTLWGLPTHYIHAPDHFTPSQKRLKQQLLDILSGVRFFFSNSVKGIILAAIPNLENIPRVYRTRLTYKNEERGKCGRSRVKMFCSAKNGNSANGNKKKGANSPNGVAWMIRGCKAG